MSFLEPSFFYRIEMEVGFISGLKVRWLLAC